MIPHLRYTMFILVAGATFCVHALELISPAAPFTEQDKAAPLEVISTLPEFTHSGIILGNKKLHWNISTPLEVLINNECCSLLTCRAETALPGWHIIAPTRVDIEAPRAVFPSEFPLNEAGDKAFFTREVLLQPDGKVQITCSWKFPEAKTNDFKAMNFRIFIPKNVAVGNAFTLNEKRLDLPAVAEWDAVPKKGLSEGKTRTLSFIYQGRKAYTLSFQESASVSVSVREQDVLVRTRSNQPFGAFKLLFDFERATKKSDSSGDCVVDDINFTACNDMTVPLYAGSANLLLNPSFESGTRYYMPADLKFTDISCNLTTNAYRGKYAYRLSQGAINRSISAMTIPILSGVSYTVSLFAKSLGPKGDNLFLTAHSYNGIRKTTRFRIASDKWERYSWTFSCPAQAARLVFSSDSEAGVLLDDLQVEKGDQATAYAGNPFGMELLIDSLDGMTARDDCALNPRLSIRGESGSSGKIAVQVSDFFRRVVLNQTFTFNIERDGHCVIPLPLDNKLPLGVSVVRTTFMPDKQPGYTDFFRINRITYVGNQHKFSGFPATRRLTSDKISDYPESELDFLQSIGVGKSRKYSLSNLTAEEVQRLKDKGIELTNVEIITVKRVTKGGGT